MERDLKADPETEAEILAALREYDQALRRGDIEAIVAMHSPEFAGFGTGGDERMVGLGEMKELAERDLVQGGSRRDNEYNFVSVSVHGSLALVVAEVVQYWLVEGRELSDSIRCTFVLEQHQHRWRFLQVHTSVPDSSQAPGQSWPTPIEAIASAVSEERPDLRAQAAPDGTVTLIFTDIENSTNLTERLGDTAWLDVLRQHNAIVREQVKANGCFEVKSQGDGFMVASQSARRAVHCAIGIQRGLAHYNETAPEPIHVRMGLHTGEVLKDADDFFGKHVILASRIAGKARGGEILVSSLLRDLTESAGDIKFGEARDVELKGLSGTYRLHDVAWHVS